MPDDVDLSVERETAWLDGQVQGLRARLQPANRLDCTDCGEPIPERRRLALPAARRCVACQTMLEAGR